LLGVDTFDEAAQKVKAMGSEGSDERVAWLEMANEIARNPEA